MIPTYRLWSMLFPIPAWDVKFSDDGYGNLLEIPLEKETETKHFLSQMAEVVKQRDVWEAAFDLYPNIEKRGLKICGS